MQTGAARVLVVDDEPEIGALIRGQLSEIGLDCQVAADPEVARRLLANKPFDLVISDISMPGTTGLDLLAHIRERGYRCRVILVTGASTREYVAQALMLGAFDYVEKPFRQKELTDAVMRAISGSPEAPHLPARAAAAMEMGSQARQASLESIQALVRAVEAKDPYTRRHSEQVAHYASNLAGAMDLSGPLLASIQTAALMHDVGKIGVPDHILTKAGPLTREEFDCIRRHPALGADILSKVTLFGQEAMLVRHYHERWDGNGYPDGLTGEESPLGARVIMVADCIDAMLMDRTYKKSYSPEKMIGELVRCAGTQFDPRIAAAAVQWCRANPHKLILPEAAQAPAAGT